MNSKRIILPAIASMLILCVLASSFSAATAQIPTYASAMPTLQVTTIAEDDQIRNTGVIVFGLIPGNPATWDKPTDQYCMANPGACVKLEAQYKLIVSFMGQPVPFSFACQFIKKEKTHPLQEEQFSREVVSTVLTDESVNFACKLRQSSPALPGVGVLDVYWVGPLKMQFIADYIMVVAVWTAIGRTTVYGTDMQDLCTLGWANSSHTIYITKPDGTLAFSWPDPLGPFVSCEDSAVLQRQNLGLGLQYS